jgi:hypothetical protein
MKTKEVIKFVGIAATLGVTGLAIIYRKQIIGFVKGGKKAVEPLTAAKLAEDELKLWGNSSIKEGDPKTMERLRDYWKSGANITNWSDSRMTNEAWSAAFISWLFYNSNKDTQLKRSASHSVYIRDAVANRKNNAKNGYFGYKPTEVKVEVGDLVCYARQGGVSYDSTGSYASHCDIVTKVDSKNGKARSIGGNVSNSVKVTEVPLTRDLKVDNSKNDKGYFVVIKNKKVRTDGQKS